MDMDMDMDMDVDMDVDMEMEMEMEMDMEMDMDMDMDMEMDMDIDMDMDMDMDMVRTARPRLVRVRCTYRQQLPRASGTYATQDAGARSLYVQVRRRLRDVRLSMGLDRRALRKVLSIREHVAVCPRQGPNA